MSFVYKGLKANFEKLTVTEHELPTARWTGSASRRRA